MYQDQPNTSSEQIEHNTVSLKESIPPEIIIDISRETPSPPRNKYKLMKDPAFLFSPVYPPILPSNFSLSTNRYAYLILILSHDHFTFKSQLTSLYRHPTDYTFKLYDIIRLSLPRLLQK